MTTMAEGAGSRTPRVRLDDVTVRFDDVSALSGVDLALATGELLAVVGPSGCGKSSLLRAVAGLATPAVGQVTIDGHVVAGPRRWVPPERRGVGVVFQDHALFPHLTVADNIGFGLRGRSDRGRRVAEVVELVGLSALSGRYPHQLSGGEQQRVALARALAPRPAVILLDEPFSNLDPNLRGSVRDETLALLRAEGVTAIFVTHDQAEALIVGDRVAVMRAGRVEQVDVPDRVYHAPTSRFVATFMDEADLLAAEQVDHVATTRFGPVRVAGPAAERPVEVMVRPHEVVLRPEPDADAVVVRTHFRGGTVAHDVRCDDGVSVRALRPHTQVLAPGTPVRVTLDAGHPLAVFPRPTPTDAALDPARP